MSHIECNGDLKIMQCERCQKYFNISEVNKEVNNIGDSFVFSCPHCSKAYKYSLIRRINIDSLTDDEVKNEVFDDWGCPIISDSEYDGGKNGKK